MSAAHEHSWNIELIHQAYYAPEAASTAPNAPSFLQLQQTSPTLPGVRQSSPLPSVEAVAAEAESLAEQQQQDLSIQIPHEIDLASETMSASSGSVGTYRFPTGTGLEASSSSAAAGHVGGLAPALPPRPVLPSGGNDLEDDRTTSENSPAEVPPLPPRPAGMPTSEGAGASSNTGAVESHHETDPTSSLEDRQEAKANPQHQAGVSASVVEQSSDAVSPTAVDQTVDHPADAAPLPAGPTDAKSKVEEEEEGEMKVGSTLPPGAAPPVLGLEPERADTSVSLTDVEK